MNNYIILDKRKNIKQVFLIIRELNMVNTIKNKRTSIWENDDLQISIDRSLIRILGYNVETIQHYFDFYYNGD